MSATREESLLAALRKRRFPKQKDAARALQVSPGYLSWLERGRVESPSLRLIRRMSEAYGYEESVILAAHRETVKARKEASA